MVEITNEIQKPARNARPKVITPLLVFTLLFYPMNYKDKSQKHTAKF